MTKQKKIAILLPFLTKMDRGNERLGANMAQTLAILGHKVNILFWKTKGKKPKKLSYGNYVELPLPRYYRSNVAPFFYILHLILFRPDVIIVFYPNQGESLTIKVLKRLLKVHVCFIVTYPFELVPARFKEFIDFGLLPKLDSVICISPAMIPGVEGIFRRETIHIPIGINLQNFKKATHTDNKALKSEYGIPLNARLVITISALEKRKGMHLVMQSIDRLAEKGVEDIYYLMVGDGPDRSFFEEHHGQMKHKDKVIFAGTHQEVLPFYQVGELFILPSYGEGFPNVLLEAWAMELPVIVSDADPYPGITTPEIAKLLPLDNPQLLDDWLLDWVENDQKWKEQANRALKHVQEVYAWPVVAKKYLEVWFNKATQ